MSTLEPKKLKQKIFLTSAEIINQKYQNVNYKLSNENMANNHRRSNLNLAKALSSSSTGADGNCANNNSETVVCRKIKFNFGLLVILN